MKETFTIKGVSIEVEYNTVLYNHSEIEKLLKYGARSQDKFEEIQAEMDILNENDARKKLFPSRSAPIIKTLDLSNYMSVVLTIGRPLEELLDETFDIKILKHLKGHTYELEGPKKGFKDLEFILSL